VTTENQPPWAAAATDEPARRKVSWGDTAHSGDAPRPRAGVPVPPSFGPTWAPETTDTTASDTALQHAGTAPPEAQHDWQVPAVPGGYVPVPTPDEPPAGADVDFASLFDDEPAALETPPAQPAVGDIFDDEPAAREAPPTPAEDPPAQPAGQDAAPVARQSMMSAHPRGSAGGARWRPRRGLPGHLAGRRTLHRHRAALRLRGPHPGAARRRGPRDPGNDPPHGALPRHTPGPRAAQRVPGPARAAAGHLRHPDRQPPGRRAHLRHRLRRAHRDRAAGPAVARR